MNNCKSIQILDPEKLNGTSLEARIINHNLSHGIRYEDEEMS